LKSEFYWGLRDDVKDLVLSLPDPQTINEVISQVVKYNNQLFERGQDHQPRTFLRGYTNRQAPTMPTSKLNFHFEVKDMQIDAICFKPLTPQKERVVLKKDSAYTVVKKVTR